MKTALRPVKARYKSIPYLSPMGVVSRGNEGKGGWLGWFTEKVSRGSHSWLDCLLEQQTANDYSGTESPLGL